MNASVCVTYRLPAKAALFRKSSLSISRGRSVKLSGAGQVKTRFQRAGGETQDPRKIIAGSRRNGTATSIDWRHLFWARKFYRSVKGPVTPRHDHAACSLLDRLVEEPHGRMRKAAVDIAKTRRHPVRWRAGGDLAPVPAILRRDDEEKKDFSSNPMGLE